MWLIVDVREALIIFVCKFWITHHEDWRSKEVKRLLIGLHEARRKSIRLLIVYEGYNSVQVVVSNASFFEGIDPCVVAQIDQYR